MLDLLRPIYAKTAAYGHFGREEPEFTWEATDKAALLRDAAGLKGEPPRRRAADTLLFQGRQDSEVKSSHHASSSAARGLSRDRHELRRLVTNHLRPGRQRVIDAM
jgi:hypothetical protein